jgi:hypothetical protein
MVELMIEIQNKDTLNNIENLSPSKILLCTNDKSSQFSVHFSLFVEIVQHNDDSLHIE